MSKIIRNENVHNASEWHMPEVNRGQLQAVESSTYLEGIAALGGGIPTAKEIGAIQKRAYDESYEEGYQDGLNIAKDEQMNIMLILSDLSKELNNLKHELNDEVKRALAELSILIAKQIIRREVVINPEYIQSVVDESITLLPVFSKSISIHLNSEDAPAIRQLIESGGHIGIWNIVEESSISRGGCKVFSEHSVLDNTLEMQVSKIAAKFLDHSNNDQHEVNI